MTTEKNYCGVRFAKMKSIKRVEGYFAHVKRLQETLNSDPAKIHLNSSPVSGSLKTYNDKLALVPKRRKDAVLALDGVLYCSQDWAEAYPDRIDEWFEINRAFLINKFGSVNIVDITHHRDETVVHTHFLVIPLVQSSQGQHCLRARHWVSNMKSLSAWQDEYAAVCRHLGLERGSRHSIAKHTDIKDFYVKLERAKDAGKALTAEMRSKLTSRLKPIVKETSGLLGKKKEVEDAETYLRRTNILKVVEELLKHAETLHYLAIHAEQLEAENVSLRNSARSSESEVKELRHEIANFDVTKILSAGQAMKIANYDLIAKDRDALRNKSHEQEKEIKRLKKVEEEYFALRQQIDSLKLDKKTA